MYVGEDCKRPIFLSPVLIMGQFRCIEIKEFINTISLTKEEMVTYILSRIEEDFGVSFDVMKERMLSSMEYGASKHFRSKNGYSLMYTSNDNYMNGVKNGGGAGFYAILYFVGMNRSIKLCTV